jgi:signal transduction histidine kinase
LGVVSKRWRDISVVKKLYFVVGVMALLIAGELLILRFAMHTLSAARAFVEGEGTWSKAQKNAIFALQRYQVTRNEHDFEAFQNFLSVSEGDHVARMELSKANPDLQRARDGFLQGRIHPDDVPAVMDLLKRFYWISYLQRAIYQWTKGDVMIEELKAKALVYHQAVQQKNTKLAESILQEVQVLDREISYVEDDFSAALGEGSRWLEHVVLSLLLLAVISVEGVGLTLAVFTSRQLARGLKDLNQAAKKIGSGNFNDPVPVHSKDEIGQLALVLDKTRLLLQGSYLELEERVRARTQELNEALAYRDEFLSVASHELKTPLTAMHLQLQLLDRKLKTDFQPEQKELFQKYSQGILDRSRRLRALLDELFDLTKVRFGKLEIHPEITDLQTLLVDTVQTFQNEAEAKGSTLLLTCSGSIPIFADPMRLSQVITNLVSNAIKYGAGKPIEVECEESGDHVVIQVKDHGNGIDAFHLDRIFGRFERANDDPNITGLGLGLYISKHIVEAHEGKIEVQSELGQGTQFIVILPLKV